MKVYNRPRRSSGGAYFLVKMWDVHTFPEGRDVKKKRNVKKNVTLKCCRCSKPPGIYSIQ